MPSSAAGFALRILFASTGLIYGDPDEPGRPCDEFTTLKPASPYAASKAAADLASFQYTRNPGLDIVRIRLFNQIGPRQSADYAVANFARQIAAIEAGKQEPRIETGDLSAQRDLTDIRDTVRAFPLLLEKGISGEAYNAGRGETFSMQSILDRLVAMSKVKVDVVQRADRKADTAVTRRREQVEANHRLGAANRAGRHIGCDPRLVAIAARLTLRHIRHDRHRFLDSQCRERPVPCGVPRMRTMQGAWNRP